MANCEQGSKTKDWVGLITADRVELAITRFGTSTANEGDRKALIWLSKLFELAIEGYEAIQGKGSITSEESLEAQSDIFEILVTKPSQFPSFRENLQNLRECAVALSEGEVSHPKVGWLADVVRQYRLLQKRRLPFSYSR